MINAITRKPYGGKNLDRLSTARIARGFKSTEWLTFLQAQSLGLKIKRGSSGVTILLVNKSQAESDDLDKNKPVRRVGHAVVFNLDQTEPAGKEQATPAPEVKPAPEPVTVAEQSAEPVKVSEPAPAPAPEPVQSVQVQTTTAGQTGWEW